MENIRTVQTALRTLSNDAEFRAQSFATKSGRLWGVVYDNINFTLRTASQRLDSATQQLNATTLAVFSLPKKYTRAAYAAALSIAERQKKLGLRRLLTLESLRPSEEHLKLVHSAFKHALRTVLLTRLPGKMRKHRQSSANPDYRVPLFVARCSTPKL